MTDQPFLAIGWQVGTLSGWGQFGAHFARTVSTAGYRVILPPGSLTDLSGVLPLDRPLLQSLQAPLPESGEGWLLMAIGNGMEERPEGLPSSIKVAGVIFCEDTGAIDAAKLNAYDLIVAGSRWTERVLKEKGVERVILAHQGYDSRVFFPGTPRQPDRYMAEATGMATVDGSRFAPGQIIEVSGGYPDNHGLIPIFDRQRPMVFSGGKLEFRKGQDIVIEAFRRFLETPEGKDAILVTAWQNLWPRTMDGIWLSDYVKGVPTVKNGKADIVGWLTQNGIPADRVIDCGTLTPPEAAHVMRSCTVGVFPNRAESGTNMVLVEALASGLPCYASGGHGHTDVVESFGFPLPVESGWPSNVPSGCRLYQSTEGWTETTPSWLAGALVRIPLEPALPDYWSWDVRGPAMAMAILNSVAVTA